MSDIITISCTKCSQEYEIEEHQISKVKCECGSLDFKKLPGASEVVGESKVTIEQTDDDVAGIAQVREAHKQLTAEVSKVVVGQRDVVDQVLIAILCGGHCLLEGVPGLAKTLLISSIAEAMHLKFKRIQFTPDLMPSDITGTEVIQEDPVSGKRSYQFMAGPIFSNIILADEINRTPPKTQAAMLEAMQEKQVSIGGTVHKLDKPFFVMATQNPLDQEGTYPLPEAQQDRFLFKVIVDYPTDEEEKSIVQMVTSQAFETISPVVNGASVLAAQAIIRKIPIADTVIDYATRLVRATRLNRPETPDFIGKWIAWGCGPRAAISLVSAAKAAAAMRGAEFVAAEDIAKVAHPVLRHRMAVNYTARAEGISSDDVIDKLLETIEPFDA